MAIDNTYPDEELNPDGTPKKQTARAPGPAPFQTVPVGQTQAQAATTGQGQSSIEFPDPNNGQPPADPNQPNNVPTPPPPPNPTTTTPPVTTPAPTPAPTPAAKPSSFKMTGWDNKKLGDSTVTSPKYLVGRVLAGFDPTKGYSPEVLAALNALGIGTFTASGDRLSVNSKDPRWNGMTSWDGIFSMHDPANAAWSFGVDSNLDAPGGPGGPGGPGSPGGPGGPGGPLGPLAPMPGTPGMPNAPNPNGPGGINDPAWKELYDELLKRSKQSLNVDPNDPIIKGQVDAAAAIANREALKQQQAAAERGGQYATGEVQNSQRAQNETVQLQMSAMQAELMGREVGARRQEIAAALASRQGMLTTEEQSRLRQEDQALERRQQDLAAQQAATQNALNQRIAEENFRQMQWERQFRDRGWESDQAQQIWQNNQTPYL